MSYTHVIHDTNDTHVIATLIFPDAHPPRREVVGRAVQQVAIKLWRIHHGGLAYRNQQQKQ